MPIELDDLDHRILAQLQRDSTLTNQALSARVHASAPTCLRRVRRLTDLGVIRCQVAILDPAKVGQPLTALVEITLDRQGDELAQSFQDHIVRDTAIQQCYRVASGPDFILVAQVPDMAAYHALAHRAFTSHANVRNVRAFFSVHCAKFETAIPLQTSTR